MPFQTGAVYAEVTGLTVGQTLVVEADGDPSVRWAIFAVDGDDSDWSEGSIFEWTVQADTVVVGAVNLGPEGFDADDPIEAADLQLNIRLGDGSAAEGEGTKVTGCACSARSAPSGSAWVWALLMAIVGAARRASNEKTGLRASRR
jgi:MYXO-CTERM domain-containing protein